MIPISIIKAIYAVLTSTGYTPRASWSTFARIESDPGSDLFIIEATDGAFSLSIAFSNPEYVDWGGCGWINTADVKMLKRGGDAAGYIQATPPKNFPEDMRERLQTFANQTLPQVDINIFAYYLHLVSTVLSHLDAQEDTVEVRCTSPLGPICLRVTGNDKSEWIEATILFMGRHRESSNKNPS